MEPTTSTSTPASSTTPASGVPVAVSADDKTVALLSYLTLLGFIVAIVLHSSKKTSLGAYHLRQCLGLMIVCIAFWPVNMVLAFIPILGWLASLVIAIGLLCIWLMGLMAAANGQKKPLPLVGPTIEKILGTTFD